MYYTAIDGSAPRCHDGDYRPRPCSTLAFYFDQGCGIVCFKVVCRFMDWRYGAKLSLFDCAFGGGQPSVWWCVLLAKLCLVVYLGRC
jgi:hypothetical protein